MNYRRHHMTVIVTLLVTAGLAFFSFSPDGNGYLFPQIIAGSMVFIALLMLALAFIPSKPITTIDEEPIPWGKIFPTLLILVGFLVVAESLGFFATSFIAFYSIVLIYTPERLKRRQFIKSAAISLGFISVLYLIFVLLLNVQIPHGVFL